MTSDSSAVPHAPLSIEANLEWSGAPSRAQHYGPAFCARTYLIDRVFRRLRPRRLLDIGCGRGYVTEIAARHAATVVAADLAVEAAAATRRVLSGHPRADVLVADIFDVLWGQELRRRGTGFDAILLSEVLEHLDDDLSALIACRELLTDGGALVLTVPGNPRLWTAWDHLAGHRRRYMREELLQKIEAAGLQVREVVNWGFPLTGWLAVRSARMRARRVLEQNSEAEVPWLLTRLLPMGAIVFRLAARVEPLFSALDYGAGYLVAAQRPAEMRNEVDIVADEAA